MEYYDCNVTLPGERGATSEETGWFVPVSRLHLAEGRHLFTATSSFLPVHHGVYDLTYQRNPYNPYKSRPAGARSKFSFAAIFTRISIAVYIIQTVQSVADTIGVSSRTVDHIKQRFVGEGVESALTRKPAGKPPREIKFDGAFEAGLIALACTDAPEGRSRWTVRLLADKAVELKITESISKSSVGSILKKLT